ncbi:hypothetical protein B0T16DRAFT_496127 [Cercophora newfieldiana]|uniref:Uncharacterized protein n=1 Tax=Cercophora newfieldiana TaxID=92897 RepID=A0AA39XW86_9PEZI|nr:hypothetical protein B0T16DRAFT_496127 [Cercophora newfieldiana]
MAAADLAELWRKAVEEWHAEKIVADRTTDEAELKKWYKNIATFWRKKNDPASAVEERPTDQPQGTIDDYLLTECSQFKEARKGTSPKAVLRVRSSPPHLSTVAFIHIVGACVTLKEDLDSIEKLFEVVFSFVDRLCLLEAKLPPEK